MPSFFSELGRLDEPILREDAELHVDKFTIPSIIRLACISQCEGDSV